MLFIELNFLLILKNILSPLLSIILDKILNQFVMGIYLLLNSVYMEITYN